MFEHVAGNFNVACWVFKTDVSLFLLDHLLYSYLNWLALFELTIILEDTFNIIRFQLLIQFSIWCAKSLRCVDKVCTGIEYSSTTSSSSTRNVERDLEVEPLESTEKPWSNGKNKGTSVCYLFSTLNLCLFISVGRAVWIRWTERIYQFVILHPLNGIIILIFHFVSVQRK